MTATETTHLVSPHGGALVDRTPFLAEGYELLKRPTPA